MSTTIDPQPAPTFASLRAELADLTLHATDRQLGAALRTWAADTDFNTAPLLAMAVLVGMLRGTIVRDAKKR